MYNLFQYRNQKQTQKEDRIKQKRYQSFLSNRQNYKNISQVHRTHRLHDFVQQQSTSFHPFVIPDQYMSRKNNHSNQPAQHQLTFDKSQNMLSSRPQFSNRNRPLVKRNSQFSLFGTTQLTKFVSKGQIPPNKTDQMKLTREDMAYLSHSMPLKESSRKKVSQSAMNFKEKATKLLNNFENEKRRWQKAMIIIKDRYRLCQPTHFNPQQIQKSNQTPKKKTKLQLPIHNVEQQDHFDSASKVYFSEIGEERKKNKTFFKLAKTAQLFESGMKKNQLDDVLNRSHYDRVKSRLAQTKPSQLSMTTRTPKGLSVSLV